MYRSHIGPISYVTDGLNEGIPLHPPVTYEMGFVYRSHLGPISYVTDGLHEGIPLHPPSRTR